MKFDKAYFIAKFTAIPDELWRTDGVYGADGETKFCALGHCGFRDQKSIGREKEAEGSALQRLFNKYNFTVIHVNDRPTASFPQPTAKARILAALNQIPDEV